MVYVIVAIALLCLTIKGYCGKKTSIFVKDTEDSFRFNLLRMLFCICFGAAFVFAEGSQFFLSISGGMAWICSLAGVSNAAVLVGWLLAIQKNSMVLVDVGLMFGSLIPAVLCALFFGEEISLLKMLGFAMILSATIILAGHNKKVCDGGFIGILILVFTSVADGMAGFSQQLYKQYYTESGMLNRGVFYPKSVYHFYTYVFAAIVLLAVIICYRIITYKRSVATGIKRDGFSLPLKVVLHILVMAICLFGANYLQTVATNDFKMPSQVLYPIIKGGCLITVNFTALIFFGEKISLRSILGSFVALGGIISTSIL